MTDPTVNEEPLERVIGKTGYAVLALNGIIGAGIFALPAVAAARVGSFSPWLFVICAVMILTIVLSFAQAATYVRNTGGMIVYATRAFGPFVGFQTGWLSWLSRVASQAANSVLMVTYLSYLFPVLEIPWVSKLAVVTLIATMSWVHAVGVRQGMLVGYVLSVLKLAPLILLVLFGLPELQASVLFDVDLPDRGTLGETVLILLYAYVGFEGAVIPAGEGRNPRRDIPIALFLTTLVITVFYFLIQWVSLSVFPDLPASDRPLAEVARILWGPVGATILVATAVFSITGNNFMAMLSAPRMTYALGRDGRLPEWFGRVHPRYRTPVNSIVLYGVCSMVLAVSGSFVWLAVMSTLVRLLSYAVVIASLPFLGRHGTPDPGAFRIPGGYTVPVIALLLTAWLVTHASAVSWLATGAFFAAGSVLYWLAGRSRAPTPDRA